MFDPFQNTFGVSKRKFYTSHLNKINQVISKTRKTYRRTRRKTKKIDSLLSSEDGCYLDCDTTVNDSPELKVTRSRETTFWVKSPFSRNSV